MKKTLPEPMFGKEESTMENTYAQQLFSMIQSSPTSFHAVRSICRRLEQEGFQELLERDAWNLSPGGRYYLTRNQSSVLAFAVPQGDYENFQIVASHSDSPTFKLKEHAAMGVNGHYTILNTERYGGMLYSTWLDRPLSIAGRVMVRRQDGISSQLIQFDRDLVLIPNLAIHMNRAANEGVAMNPQVDLLPLFGDERAKDSLCQLVAKECSAQPQEIVGSDLYLYNRCAPSIWGANREYLSCPQLDDLECVFASLEAFLSSQPSRSIKVCAVFDNEEVGSSTKQGAASTFLYDTLQRVNWSLGGTMEDYHRAVASSFMVSADNAHAQHPNHPEKTDSTNCVYLNEGVVVKHNANQKYTTDGVSAAVFQSLCERASVPVQHFANRSDIPGGSTLGNLSTLQVPMNTVDIGLAQLAMHSSYETAGVKDLEYLVRALREFYSSTVTMVSDGSCRIEKQQPQA